MSNAKRLALEERREQVVELLKRRIPQNEIARRLGVNKGTISRDVKAILKLYHEKVVAKAEHLRAREAQSLDHMELVAQLNLEKALAKRQKVEDQDPEGKESRAWERYDRAARGWFEERVRVQERRAKLLHLDRQASRGNAQVTVPITFIQAAPPAEAQALPSAKPTLIDPGEGQYDD